MDNVVVRQRQKTFKVEGEKRIVIYLWVCSYCGKSYTKNSNLELVPMKSDKSQSRKKIRGGVGGRQTHL